MKTSNREHWEKFWQRRDPNELYDTGLRIVKHLSRVTDVSGKKILEVGAGTGRDSIELSKMGADVWVLDYADNSLSLTRQEALKAGVNLKMVQGDAFNLPLPDNSFDIVFHQGLLEHFRNPDGIVSENVRILKPGGLMIIDVPQTFHVYTIMKKILIFLNKWFAGWETQFSICAVRKKVKHYPMEIIYEYGEYMEPSLAYRLLREIVWVIGIKLPMFPPRIPVLRSLRDFIRKVADKTPLLLYTGLSIGVISRKK